MEKYSGASDISPDEDIFNFYETPIPFALRESP
jgi:hypothetical protein